MVASQQLPAQSLLQSIPLTSIAETKIPPPTLQITTMEVAAAQDKMVATPSNPVGLVAMSPMPDIMTMHADPSALQPMTAMLAEDNLMVTDNSSSSQLQLEVLLQVPTFLASPVLCTNLPNDIFLSKSLINNLFLSHRNRT